MKTSEEAEDLVADAASALQTLLDRKLTPEEFERLKIGLSDPLVLEALLFSDYSYLVLGSYGTEELGGDEKERLKAVRNVLNDRHPDHHAFLLDDLPDFYPSWVVQFVVAAKRVDLVVGVFEHNFGGHEYEAGVLTLLKPNDLWILKRAYRSESEEHEQYDGMLAHFFELVDARDEFREWTTEGELETLANREIPGLDADDA